MQEMICENSEKCDCRIDCYQGNSHPVGEDCKTKIQCLDRGKMVKCVPVTKEKEEK
jgi:hypothetical protein